LNREFDLALKVAIKRGNSLQLFEFLNQTKLDLNLKEYLSKLLLIDMSKTIQYLMEKYKQQL